MRAGTRLLIHGGWGGDGLGDMHALELDAALTVSDARRAADAAASTRPRGLVGGATLRHAGAALAALILSACVYAACSAES